MSGAVILFDERHFRDQFSKLVERGNNLEQPLREIGEYALISTRARFDSMTDPDGIPWPALEDRYKKSKTQNQDRILVYHGYLVGTLAYQLVDGGVEWGSNLVYAASMQFGRGNIPSRPYLGFSVEDRKEIAEILGGHLAP